MIAKVAPTLDQMLGHNGKYEGLSAFFAKNEGYIDAATSSAGLYHSVWFASQSAYEAYTCFSDYARSLFIASSALHIASGTAYGMALYLKTKAPPMAHICFCAGSGLRKAAMYVEWKANRIRY